MIPIQHSMETARLIPNYIESTDDIEDSEQVDQEKQNEAKEKTKELLPRKSKGNSFIEEESLSWKQKMYAIMKMLVINAVPVFTTFYSEYLIFQSGSHHYYPPLQLLFDILKANKFCISRESLMQIQNRLKTILMHTNASLSRDFFIAC
jgi:hypothetical protein